MPYKKGQSGNPKGKPKGAVSKFTRSAKEAFQLAFDEMGGYKALAEWGKENRGDFYRIYGRLIPVDVTSGGEPITAIQVTVIDGNNGHT